MAGLIIDRKTFFYVSSGPLAACKAAQISLASDLTDHFTTLEPRHPLIQECHVIEKCRSDLATNIVKCPVGKPLVLSVQLQEIGVRTS